MIYEEKEYNRYEILKENISQTGVYRPIEHSCKNENEKLKLTLIETNILGEPKYRNKKGKECPDIESF